MPWVYILLCAGGSYYVGHTADLESRLKSHKQGAASGWTAARRPIRLVYQEELPSRSTAIARERQLKRWSARKKCALIAGNRAELKRLSRCRRTERGRQHP